ncbi:hypothetical protein ABTN50_18880, partial [Acinetobacter baumannii]
KLATLAPGTTPSLRSAERNTFVANGTRPIQNSYILDGVENKNKIVGFDSSTAQVIEPVLDGIYAAKAAGLAVKINAVALKGVNEHEFDRMIAWCGEHGF